MQGQILIVMCTQTRDQFKTHPRIRGYCNVSSRNRTSSPVQALEQMSNSLTSRPLRLFTLPICQIGWTGYKNDNKMENGKWTLRLTGEVQLRNLTLYLRVENTRSELDHKNQM